MAESVSDKASLTREEINSIVDVKKPLFFQVHKLGRHYEEWTHRPLAGTFRLFESDFLEMFTKTHWWVIPVYWIPVIIQLMVAGSFCTTAGTPDRQIYRTSNDSDVFEQTFVPRHISVLNANLDTACLVLAPSVQGTTFSQAVIFFLAGILMWTLLEYCLHRFVFHMKISGDSAIFTTFHFTIHGLHHKFPLDPLRLVFPPVPGSAIVYGFYCCYCTILPLHLARTLLGGTMFGYIMYDLLHYYIHHGKPQASYLVNLKDAHVAHHFRDHSKGFGISSKLWDFPFGTLGDTTTKKE